MSIKYGKSKKQYISIDGEWKEVVNLTIYVEKDKVCVKWDEINEFT